MDKTSLISEISAYFSRQAEVFDVDAAFVYGSWSGGRPREDSDVDVAVMFRHEAEAEEAFERVTAIALDLTRLLKREVNVLHMDRELSRPMLHYNAIVHGTLVYRSGGDAYADLRMRAISMMEDFALFGEAWQSEIARKRMEELRHA